MANLWQHRPDQDDWEPMGVEDEVRVGSARLYRYAESVTARERWALLVGRRSGVRVNGELVGTGLRSLRDRDAIEADGALFFFTTERLPVVTAMPADPARVVCGRCRTSIAEGSPAVSCPQCGVWHHGSEALPCWGSLPKCSLCDGSTAGVAYAWTPRSL